MWHGCSRCKQSYLLYIFPIVTLYLSQYYSLSFYNSFTISFPMFQVIKVIQNVESVPCVGNLWYCRSQFGPYVISNHPCMQSAPYASSPWCMWLLSLATFHFVQNNTVINHQLDRAGCRWQLQISGRYVGDMWEISGRYVADTGRYLGVSGPRGTLICPVWSQGHSDPFSSLKPQTDLSALSAAMAEWSYCCQNGDISQVWVFFQSLNIYCQIYLNFTLLLLN